MFLRSLFEKDLIRRNEQKRKKILHTRDTISLRDNLSMCADSSTKKKITETNRNKQKLTETDRNRQKLTETDRNGHN